MEDDERTTGELLLALDSDYRRCYAGILDRINEGEHLEDGTISADHEFDARQLIRAAFAYIEGATFVLKIEASFNSEENGIELLPQQNHFIFESGFELSDKGVVLEKAAKIPLSKNVRFAFNVFAQANGISFTFDPSVEWWSLFKDSTRVRDRLTHPRMPQDLDVTPREVIAMINAKDGFDGVLYYLLGARGA
ncbi:hypothetical protein WCE55_05045 [Luteimonas sp. MJ293]|uniref:hypothetical protein n=1 Tax=Luteimonas sp. MJ146 TaxID=3129240 RepID=UPI0031BA4A1B